MRRLAARFGSRVSSPGSERVCGIEDTGVLKRIMEAIGRELRHRHAMRHLDSMTDYELHDIGLIRSQIDGVVRHGRRD